MTMTEQQFDFIARLIRCKDPAKQGARLVLVHHVPNAEAARSVGTTPQAVHRAAKRIAEEHNEARRLYQKQLPNPLGVDKVEPSNPRNESVKEPERLARTKKYAGWLKKVDAELRRCGKPASGTQNVAWLEMQYNAHVDPETVALLCGGESVPRT